MEEESQRKGFTIVEVSLVLAISGLILIGVINGVSGSVARQRYNDSVQSVTEDLRRAYTDAANPQGLSDSGGKSNTLIYGKLVVVKASAIEVSTVTGNIANYSDETLDLISTIISVNPKVEPDSTKTYTLPWSAEIQKKNGKKFKGSFLIVYSPNGGAIHTFYRSAIVSALDEDTLKDFKTANANLCIDSPDLYAAGGIRRNIRIASDGRNSSAVQLIDVNSEDNQCV